MVAPWRRTETTGPVSAEALPDLVTTERSWWRASLAWAALSVILVVAVRLGYRGDADFDPVEGQLALGRLAGYLTLGLGAAALIRAHLLADAGAKRVSAALIAWGLLVGLGGIGETDLSGGSVPDAVFTSLRLSGLAVAAWLLITAGLNMQVGAQVPARKLLREMAVPFAVAGLVTANIVVFGRPLLDRLEGPLPTHAGVAITLWVAVVALHLFRTRLGNLEDGTSTLVLTTFALTETCLVAAGSHADRWVTVAICIHVAAISAIAGKWLVESVQRIRDGNKQLRSTEVTERLRLETERTAELARRERIHDARSSILAVQTAAMTLKKQAELDRNGHAALAEAIRSEVRRLEHLIEEDGGHKFEPFRLADAVRDPIELHRTAGHRVAMCVPEALWADGSHDDVARIVRTLLDNAAAYAPGSVVVASATNIGDELVLRITDGGPGIPDHEREQVFGADVRGSTSIGTAGTGLGLAGARKLAREAGGDLVVEDSRAGASFALHLRQADSVAAGA